MRDAPSRVLMEALWAAGAHVRAFDPEAMQETQRLYADEAHLSLMGTPESTLNGADALVVCTEWQQFKAPDFDLIKQRLKTRSFLTDATCTTANAWPAKACNTSRWDAESPATCRSHKAFNALSDACPVTP